jgi:hypothetical protein
MIPEYSKRNPWEFFLMAPLDCRRIIPIPERKGIMEIRIKTTINFLRNFIIASLKISFLTCSDSELPAGMSLVLKKGNYTNYDSPVLRRCQGRKMPDFLIFAGISRFLLSGRDGPGG